MTCLSCQTTGPKIIFARPQYNVRHFIYLVCHSCTIEISGQTDHGQNRTRKLRRKCSFVLLSDLVLVSIRKLHINAANNFVYKHGDVLQFKVSSTKKGFIFVVLAFLKQNGRQLCNTTFSVTT